MAVKLNDIMDTITTRIAGITVANGYSYNWGTVNKRNETMSTSPSADCRFLSEVSDDNQFAGFVFADLEIEIAVDRVTATDGVPAVDIDRDIISYVDDVKALFIGTNKMCLAGYGSIAYEGFERRYNASTVNPLAITTKWKVHYNPTEG